MTIEELQAENAELRRQIAEDREKGQDLTVKTIFKLSDEIKALKAQIEEYEQKVKDGRLVELPYSIGDTIYLFYAEHAEKWELKKITLTANDVFLSLGNQRNTAAGKTCSLKELRERSLIIDSKEAEERYKEIQDVGKNKATGQNGTEIR